MATETISQLPVTLYASPTADYLEISQYSTAPGTTYVSKRLTPQTLVTGVALGKIASGLEYTISNQGSALVTGVQPYITMPYTGIITAATLVGSPSGSLTIDIWRCTYSQFDGGSTHPVVADSICGGHPLAISSGTKTTSSLNNWTLSLNVGDILAFNISSVSGMTQATLSLYLSRSL